MRKFFKNIIAVILLIIGFIGGFIPILQGWFFILTGFILLDFKKKHEYKQKLVVIISKTRLGKRLIAKWYRAKNNRQLNKEIKWD